MDFHAFWQMLVAMGMTHDEAFLAALLYCPQV
jgi:hypothetical protein